MNSDKTDIELIQEFQDGNEGSFNDLVRRHLPNTYGFFITICKNEMDAEDLAQDVFLKMHRALKNFRFESAFSTYLYRANTNMANSYIRNKRWRGLLNLDDTPEAGEWDTSHETDWRRQELWDAVAKLPKLQRNVVMMRIAQELPFKEISAILNTTESSAKTSYHYAVKTLKIWLENE